MMRNISKALFPFIRQEFTPPPVFGRIRPFASIPSNPLFSSSYHRYLSLCPEVPIEGHKTHTTVFEAKRYFGTRGNIQEKAPVSYLDAVRNDPKFAFTSPDTYLACKQEIKQLSNLKEPQIASLAIEIVQKIPWDPRIRTKEEKEELLKHPVDCLSALPLEKIRTLAHKKELLFAFLRCRAKDDMAQVLIRKFPNLAPCDEQEKIEILCDILNPIREDRLYHGFSLWEPNEMDNPELIGRAVLTLLNQSFPPREPLRSGNELKPNNWNISFILNLFPLEHLSDQDRRAAALLLSEERGLTEQDTFLCLKNLGIAKIDDPEFHQAMAVRFATREIARYLFEFPVPEKGILPALQVLSNENIVPPFPPEFAKRLSDAPEILRKQIVLHLVNSPLRKPGEQLLACRPENITDPDFRRVFSEALVKEAVLNSKANVADFLEILLHFDPEGVFRKQFVTRRLACNDHTHVSWWSLFLKHLHTEIGFSEEERLELCEKIFTKSEEDRQNRYYTNPISPGKTLKILSSVPLEPKNRVTLWKAAYDSSSSREQSDEVISILSDKIYTDLPGFLPEAHRLLEPLWSSDNAKLIIKRILGYRNKEMGKRLLLQFLQRQSDPVYRTLFSSLSLRGKKKDLVPHTILPAILLAKWMQEAGLTTPPTDLVSFLQEYRLDLRNSNKPLLPRFLQTVRILDTSYLSPDLRLQILSDACKPKNNPKQILENLSGAASLAVLDPNALQAVYKDPQGDRDIQKLFLQSFSSRFDLDEIPEERLSELYMETFGSMRQAGALETFITTLSSRPETQKPLETFIKEVLTGQYETERLRTDNNPHLHMIQEKYPDFFEKWRSWQKEIPLHSGTTSSKKIPNLPGFFQEKLSHGHWHKDGEDKLPRLTRFLQTGQVEEEPEKKTRTTELETLCLRLLTESLPEEERQALLEQIVSFAEKERLELGNDVKSLLPSSAPVKPLRAVAVFSRKWEDRMLMGTEVEGSCLRIDGGTYAQCVLGGEDLLVIRDLDSGQILARRQLLLLDDPEHNAPAFLLTPLYKNAKAPPGSDAALLALAQAMADECGGSIFLGQSSDLTEQIPRKLVSYTSSSPFAYIDDLPQGQRFVQHGNFSLPAYRLRV